MRVRKSRYHVPFSLGGFDLVHKQKYIKLREEAELLGVCPRHPDLPLLEGFKYCKICDENLTRVNAYRHERRFRYKLK